MQIEGIPEGYELVRISKVVRKGEYTLPNCESDPITPFQGEDSEFKRYHIIIRKLEPVTVRLKPGIYTKDADGTTDRWDLHDNPHIDDGDEFWSSETSPETSQYGLGECIEFSSPDWTKCRVVVE